LGKLNHLLRTAEARRIAAIFTATHQHYTPITGADARSYYRAAGYNL
jgi:hypothetical protein